MTILYINYIDCGLMAAGSTVRPMKMLEAFRQSGYNVLELIGEQTRSDRPRKVKWITREIEKNKPDMCYIESPVHPIYRRCDRKLIIKLHEMGVPIGYFYRDFYLKFRDDFPRRSDSVFNYMKDVVWDYLQKKTDKVLKFCDIIYLPSEECRELFDYKDMRSLPPAGDNHLSPLKQFNHTCIYVGGWGGTYDGSFLLDVFGELHQEDPSYHLIVVCRKKDWDSFSHKYKNARWLEVHHTSGDGLSPLYEKSAIGLLISNKKYKYEKYGVSVKAFEYMGYCLPVVGVNSTALKNIVSKEQMGITVEPSVPDYISAIKTILKDERTYKRFADSVRESLLSRNLWSHRVQKVVSDLSTYRCEK